MPVNQTIRGRLGATITEATVIGERNAVFRDRVAKSHWGNVDDDEPVESPVPVWNEPGNPNKLNKNLLWELVGPVGSAPGTDDQLRGHLLRELGNRESVWQLMQDAVTAVRNGTTTLFMDAPLAEVSKMGLTNAAGGPIDLVELMRILHMFGKPHSADAPRPVDPITPAHYFYASEQEVAVEIRRRVRELAAGIAWEGKVTGGKERKKLVWNRSGFYCGCG